MRKLKICFWGNIFSAFEGRPAGGPEKQIALLARVLSEMGHEVSVADTRISQDVVISDNLIFISARRAWMSPLFQRIRRFQNIFDKIDADVYYARLRSTWHLFPYLASRKAKGLFVLALAHDLDTLTFSGRFKIYYSRNGWRKFAKHLIHTELIFEHLLKKAHIVFAQHNGQVENLEKKGVQAVLCPNIANLQNPERVNPTFSEYYLFVGQLNELKGLNEIVALVTSCPMKNFVIIGRAANLTAKEHIAELSSRPNLIYLGQLPIATVLGWVSKAEALVVPSIMEGFPNTMLESWALGTPVISLHSNPGGVFKNRFLGEFCNGKMECLISTVESFTPGRYDREDMLNYVLRRHSADSVARMFLREIELHLQSGGVQQTDETIGEPNVREK